MNKTVLIAVILVSLVGFACATDCSSYFSSASSRRDKIVSKTSSIVLTSGRLYSATGNLYNSIDDLDRTENLTSVGDEVSNVISKRDDVNDELKDVYNYIDDYDNAISDASGGLPSACRDLYNAYDDDITRIKTWEKDVKKGWTKFSTYYEPVAAFNNNLAGYKADSNTRSKANDLESYTSDLRDDIGDGVDWILNGTSPNYNISLMNTTDCFAMVNKNIAITNAACNAKWQAYVTKAIQNCTVASACPICPTCQVCSNCDAVVKDVQDKYSQCQGQLSVLQSQQPTQGTVAPVNCASNDQIAHLQKQVSDADALNQNLTAQLKAKGNGICPQCSSCLLYQALALGLLLLIILAWVFAL